MKFLKYLAIAMIAVAMVACGDDDDQEPTSTYTRDFNMIFPQLAAGHKSISKIECTYNNGSTTVATADYEGNHLKSVKVVINGKYDYHNEVKVYFDYKNGVIMCNKNTYAFEINNEGAITTIKNVATGRNDCVVQYDENNQVEQAVTKTSDATNLTKVVWENGNLIQWESDGTSKSDSVVYEYGAGAIPNKGGIDVPGNDTFAFNVFVCAIMRNAGLFGATSAYLPTALKKGNDSEGDDPNTPTQLKRRSITYDDIDAAGYVKRYTTTEDQKYTVKITYR